MLRAAAAAAVAAASRGHLSPVAVTYVLIGNGGGKLRIITSSSYSTKCDLSGGGGSTDGHGLYHYQPRRRAAPAMVTFVDPRARSVAVVLRYQFLR